MMMMLLLLLLLLLLQACDPHTFLSQRRAGGERGSDQDQQVVYGRTDAGQPAEVSDM